MSNPIRTNRTFYVRRPVNNLMKSRTVDFTMLKPEIEKSYRDRIKKDLMMDISMAFYEMCAKLSEGERERLALGSIQFTEQERAHQYLTEFRADAVVYELGELPVYIDGSEVATSEDRMVPILGTFQSAWDANPAHTTMEYTTQRMTKYDKLDKPIHGWEGTM